MTDEERIAVRKYLPKPGFSIVTEDAATYGVLMQLLMGIGFTYVTGAASGLVFDPDYTRVSVDVENAIISRNRASALPKIGMFQEISFDELLQLLEKATDEEIAKNAERDAALVSLKSLGLIKRPRI